MANYQDKVAKSLASEAFARINQWRRQFIRPFAPDEIRILLKLSEKIDALWAEHARQLAADRERTEDPLPVWPEEIPLYLWERGQG